MFKYDNDCAGQTPYTVYDSKLDWYSMIGIPVSLASHFPILHYKYCMSHIYRIYMHVWQIDDEIMFRICEEYDNFTENHLIGFD